MNMSEWIWFRVLHLYFRLSEINLYLVTLFIKDNVESALCFVPDLQPDSLVTVKLVAFSLHLFLALVTLLGFIIGSHFT